MKTYRITENLDIDLEALTWHCHQCGHGLGSATENFKRGCLVYERDPHEIYPPIYPGDSPFTLTVQPGYGLFVEFYCPGCATMLENECLPPGYPPTHDVQPDLEKLQAKFLNSEEATSV